LISSDFGQVRAKNETVNEGTMEWWNEAAEIFFGSRVEPRIFVPMSLVGIGAFLCSTGKNTKKEQ
jgi:hypothetical protein